MSDVLSIVLQDSGVARGMGAPGMVQGFVLSLLCPTEFKCEYKPAGDRYSQPDKCYFSLSISNV